MRCMRNFRNGLIATGVFVLASAPAVAQTPAKPVEVAVAPIECWWKTDRSAVRVGERFDLTLTCAVLDTEKVKVVVDESSLAPSALHLVPFEIVEGQRFRDINNAPRRFFQYRYSMRVLGEEFFGKEITLPRLQLSYRVQNSLNGSSSLAGREEQYSLRPVPMRILSLVPAGTIEIRDTPPDTFGDVDSRLFRSNVLMMVAGVALVLAALVAILLLARTAVKRRASVASRLRVVSPGAVLRAASGELARVRKASENEGWNSDLAGRAASALRLAGAVALNRQVSQRHVERHAVPGEGQIMVGRGIRGKRLAVSAGVTPGTAQPNGTASISGRAKALWESVSQPLGIFTTARYSRNGSLDGTALDHALAEGQDAVKRLRLYQWQRIVRDRRFTRRSLDEGGHKQTWAR
jgi:hypothetical protein